MKRNRFLKKIIIIGLALTVFTTGLFFRGKLIHAQATFDIYSSKDIITDIYPEIPGPNQEVKLKLKSYVFNLNNYYIAWFLNGQRIKAGYGEREFSFQTGGPGQVTRVQAIIEINGKTYKKNYRFSPAEVDILWEAVDAYTPPFYQGKALPLYEGKVKLVAVPETRIIAPKDSPNLVYYWVRNKKNVIGNSGFGKDSYTFSIDPLVKKEEVKVRTNDRRENSFAENTIIIPVEKFKPKILFYEIDKDGRLLTNRALNSFNDINGDSIHLSFHPLNMSTVKPNFTDLFVGWSINGEEKPPQDFSRQNELSITTKGKSGEVKIGLTLEHIQHILQSAKETLILNFSGDKNNS